MPTRMSHPEHGVLHAVGAEVEWNKKHGWKVDPKDVPKDVQVIKPTEVTQITARRGRPPKAA